MRIIVIDDEIEGNEIPRICSYKRVVNTPDLFNVLRINRALYGDIRDTNISHRIWCN